MCGCFSFFSFFLFGTEEIGETKEKPEIRPQDGSKKQDSSDDQNSPRGVLEIPVLGGDSDHSTCSSCSSSSNDKSTVHQELVRETHRSHWKSLFGALKKKSVRRFSTIPSLAGHELSRISLRRKLARIRSAEDPISVEGMPVPKPSWRSFDYAELAAATDNFSSGEDNPFSLFHFIASIYIYCNLIDLRLYGRGYK